MAGHSTLHHITPGHLHFNTPESIQPWNHLTLETYPRQVLNYACTHSHPSGVKHVGIKSLAQAKQRYLNVDTEETLSDHISLKTCTKR